MILRWFLIIAVLVVGSIYDCKYYKLPIWLLGLGLLGGLFCWMLQGKELTELLPGMLPGLVALVLSYITQEQIGYGDGIILLIIGCCLGVKYCVWIVFAALLGCFLTSLLLIIFHKAKKKARIPFVPYMCIGTIVVMIGSLI